MRNANKKVWQSQLANELLESEGGENVEEAALRYVDRKLSRFQGIWKPPIDLKIIASILSINPNFQYTDMEQAARIVPYESKPRIDVNKKHPKVRQRFSIAHEIAHQLLNGKKINGVKSRDGDINLENGEEEDLCDLIASYIVGLRPELLRPIFSEKGLSLETLLYISKLFEVSFEATVQAATNWIDQCAAILYCIPLKNSNDAIPRFILNRYYATSTFVPLLSIKSLLPELACMGRAFLNNGTISKMSESMLINKTIYSYNCHAKKMPIYIGEKSEDGIVLLLLGQ